MHTESHFIFTAYLNKMVKVFLAIIFFSTFSACGEKHVPDEVKNSLFKKEPLAQDMRWESNKGLFKVYYTLNKIKKTSYFDEKGNWVETETEIANEKLPQAIINVLNYQYFEYQLEDVELIETFDKQVLYEVDLRNGDKKCDILFDGSGKMLRKKLRYTN